MTNDADPVTVDELRAEVADAASNGRAAAARRRRFRDAALCLSPIVLAALDGDLAKHIGLLATFGVCALAALAFFGWARMSSGRTGRKEVDELVGKVQRCANCSRLVLPDDQGECVACGHLVNSRRTLLYAGVFVAVMIMLALRRTGLLQ
jgi:hypothetical protein